MNYEECILFGKGNRGDFKKYRAVIDGLFMIEKLDTSVKLIFKN